MGIMLDHLFNESLLHYLSIMCVTMIVFCVCMNDYVHLLSQYILLLMAKLLVMSFGSSCGSLFPFALLWCCQYVKGTKQILIAQCVEFSRLHSDFIVCEFQMYTVHFTGLFCKCIYRFSVFLQHYSGNHSCQNYFVKTTDFFFFYSVGVLFYIFFLFTSIVLAMCTEKGALLFSLTFC